MFQTAVAAAAAVATGQCNVTGFVTLALRKHASLYNKSVTIFVLTLCMLTISVLVNTQKNHDSFQEKCTSKNIIDN